MGHSEVNQTKSFPSRTNSNHYRPHGENMEEQDDSTGVGFFEPPADTRSNMGIGGHLKVVSAPI